MLARGVRLRRATLDDAVEVAAVFEEARGTMTYLPELHTAEETRAFIQHQLTEEESRVAFQAGAVLGFAIFGNGWLHHLYVRRRRMGIGTALLGEVKRLSDGGLQLWTFQANMGARRFYERHGFVVVEETDGTGNEEGLPDVRYEWRQD